MTPHRGHFPQSKFSNPVPQPPVDELRNGRIKGYYVGYKLHNSSELHLYKTVEAKAMKNNGQLGECVLHNLRKFTKYSILVQAYNSIGAGPRSDEIVVSTAEDGRFHRRCSLTPDQ